ncbi:hypothetical protein FTUN_7508 [Frigoriglobus tundricola]|uniref:Carboxypeptidase regulatory-like domain-containing protein n=1 Tax=Frigoriglobus tundricola TaxID=2774151 RepID=A0A6M5Z149_9BACT|nr:hypothetical protein FTUN_7508 [Frigoriglobus tundricola]
MRLTPDEPVRGKVIDLEGKPVAGVSVSVDRMCGPRAEKTLDRWLKVTRDPKADVHVQFELLERGADPTGLIPAVTSDRDGKFEIRGVGRDRLVNLRVTGPTCETHDLTVVTRRVERFTSNRLLNGWGPTVQGIEPVAVAAPVPVTKGRVLDAATGKPIPGSVLCVQYQPWEPVVADTEGRFTLPGLPPRKNEFGVVVFPPTGSPYHRIVATVPADATARAAFNLKLTRGIPATVKIVDKTTRRPVEVALQYRVFEADNPNVKQVPNVWHHGEWADAPNVSAARKSEYQIVVFPGLGLLAAGVRWSERDYLPQVGVEAFDKYNDGNQISGLGGMNIIPSEWNTFARVDVPADAKGFTVTLELDRGLTAAGRLVDGGGKPLAGAKAHGLRRGLPGQGGWVPTADATFTVTALRAGEKRRVMFVHPERKLAGAAVAVGGAKEPLEVRMEPWGEVTGRLVGVNGEPARGRVDLSPDFNWVTDLERGSSPFSHPELVGPEADAKGRFRITGLVPGQTYRWNAVGYNKFTTVKVPDTVAKSGKTIDLGDIVLSEGEP